jgi:hypothetical protein
LKWGDLRSSHQKLEWKRKKAYDFLQTSFALFSFAPEWRLPLACDSPLKQNTLGLGEECPLN